ncbi:hypothetical protein QTP86_000467 [Hemibagrus guttatus]|nr:hypothetical protein QTP86_000467 [Hemibagrus guttatus]
MFTDSKGITDSIHFRSVEARVNNDPEIGLLLVEEVEEDGEYTDRERRGKETRWKGSKARSIGAGFKLFYYGVDSKRNGVGVVLKEEFVRNGKERNLEGQTLVHFAKRMDMAVVNTYFQKSEEHRLTYKSGDLEKAYDRVPREELWYCMRKSGVAEKYVRVVQDMYERSRTVVRCAVGQTEEFKVEVGLHQGSALSPFLFAIVMDQLSEEVRQESPWTMMFADECVNEREGSGTVRLQGEEVKKVQEFKYLGLTVQSYGECGKEVKKRVQAGWNGWRKVWGVLCDRKISARIKGKVYRTVVRPAMLYGLETVSLRKRQESELEVAELKMLRFSLGVTRLDRIRNEYIRGTAHVGRLGDKVREARLRWFGYVQRRESEYIGRRMLDMELPGRRQRGRPKRRMMEGKRSDSPEPSCVSMKSDQSMDRPLNFRDSSTDVRCESSNRTRVRTKSGPNKRTETCLKRWSRYTFKRTLEQFVCESLGSVYQPKLKSKLREKCKRINEGISQHGSSALLNEIYTELYITEGWSGGINNEHEVRQIETASRRPATQETPIKCNDLFKDKSIRSVLTKGVAGIGKTVSVQKFILDWTEGKANQDVFFMFPLPFRELNLMKQQNLSLMKLLHHFFPEMKKLELIDCDSYKVVLIFDGLDECRLPLNFQKNERLCDVTESVSVDVLLTNLIKRNLLPSALLWITSRPGAANQIPPECVDQVTEVRGFSDPQKEEYFRKRISDQRLANKIIRHMKSSRSLYIMCHIPVFCWISATVLERMLGEAESGEIPKTLTQMFTHFLIFQIKHKDRKYHQKCDPDPQQTRESVLALGKLAFQQLEKGNLIFYEEDLRESGIDEREVSVYSGVCTQIFREEFGLHLGKVFSFVHLSVQEFLAFFIRISLFHQQKCNRTTNH